MFNFACISLESLQSVAGFSILCNPARKHCAHYMGYPQLSLQEAAYGYHAAQNTSDIGHEPMTVRPFIPTLYNLVRLLTSASFPVNWDVPMGRPVPTRGCSEIDAFQISIFIQLFRVPRDDNVL